MKVGQAQGVRIRGRWSSHKEVALTLPGGLCVLKTQCVLGWGEGIGEDSSGSLHGGMGRDGRGWPV